jgi:hypothetical protein
MFQGNKKQDHYKITYHAHSTNDEEGLPSEVIQEKDCRECEDDLEHACNSCCKEVSSDGSEAEGLEDLRSVVQDSVNSREPVYS